MFMLDQWEALEANEKYDPETLRVAKELAFEMCQSLLDRMGLSATTDESALRIAGRGATFVVPLRGSSVPMKYANKQARSGSSRNPSRRGEEF